MARLFYTGFETGSTEWNGASSNTSIQTSIKRTGDYGCGFIGAGATGDRYFRQVFDASETNIFGRMALYLRSEATLNSFDLLRFRDENNSTQCSVRYDSGTQTLSWHDGAGTRIGTLGNVLIPAATWVVLEFAIVVDDVSGSLTLKINGTTDSVFSGDTDYTDNGYIRSVYVGYSWVSGGTSLPYVYVDDIAINNDQGSYQASYAGLGGVFYLYPTADGAQNDWTPSAGSVNYEMVDETPPDNATTFNQALDTGSIDLYEVSDCPQYIASINCLQVAYRAALVTSGYNELTDLVRVGTVNYSGTEYTIVPITPAFTYYLGTIHYLNPGTGTIWGTVEVNAMQAGIEITT